MLIPILLMVIFVFLFLYITGDGNILKGSGSSSIFYTMLATLRQLTGLLQKPSKIQDTSCRMQDRAVFLTCLLYLDSCILKVCNTSVVKLGVYRERIQIHRAEVHVPNTLYLYLYNHLHRPLQIPIPRHD